MMSPKRMTEDELAQRIDEFVGFCMACGAETDGVEPDAERYECQECGCMAVDGIEVLLLRGDIQVQA